MVDQVSRGEDGGLDSDQAGGESSQLAQAEGASGETIGAIQEISGTVTLTRADGLIEQASVGSPVYQNDTVATSADGAVEILFADGMTFSLGANAEMDLNNLVYNPGGAGNALDLSVVKGAFVFITGGIAPAEGEGVKIDTPAGTIGIRGTSGGGTQDPQTGGWTFMLFADPNGNVGRIVIRNAAGEVVLDEALETTQVGSALTEPSRTFILTEAQAAALFSDALASLQDILNIGSGSEDIEPEAGQGEMPAPDPQALLGELSDIVDGLANGTETLAEILTNELLQDFSDLEVTNGTTSNTLDSTDSGAGGTENTTMSSDTGPTPITDENFTPPSSPPPDLTGDDGDNTINGTGGSELIEGLGGNDSLAGGGGSDTIEGGTGSDTIDGGGGNDTVVGGEGNDTIDGGDGSNVAVFSGPLADYTILIDGGQLALTIGGTSPLSLVPPDAVITVIGPDGTDTLTNVDELRFSDRTLFVGGSNHAPETPTDGDGTANSVSESAAIGAAVGIDADSFDSDLLDVVTFTLTDDAGGLFAIDPDTGVVTVAGALDFETAESHQITVQASDGNGGLSSQSFNINVTNANDNAPSTPVDANGAANSVAEDAAVGTAVGITASSTDLDGDTVTYSLTDDAGGLFAIGPSTGVVTVAGALDFETAESHQITVQASDGNGGLSSQSFNINVTNGNDNAPSTPVDANGAANSVAEDAAVGTAVGITASSTDLDGDTVTYSLTDDAGGLFAIDPDTGVVTVAGALDFETAESHQITFQASDGNGGLSSQSFIIAVTDVNENLAPVASDSFAYGGEDEGAIQIILSGTDEDGTVQSVTLSSLPLNGTLYIDDSLTTEAQTGVPYPGSSVTFYFVPDENFNGDATFQYTVTDDQGASDPTPATASITVDSINDDPVITSDGGGDTAAISVDENTAAVTTVTATDVDSATVTFSIVGGFDGNLFTIDSVTGALSFIAPPDFENPDLNGGGFDQLYDVQVRATDSQGGTDDQLITVTVTDVDDTPPDAPVITGFSDDTGEPGDGITGDNTLIIEGRAEAGSAVEIFQDGQSIGTTSANVDGVWSFGPTNILPNGAYAFTATATDLAGNTSADSNALNVTISTAAPTAVDDFGFVNEDQDDQQLATEGAAMKTSVTVEAGAVLTLQFNFLDSEPLSAEPFFKDFAVVVIDGQVFKLADVDDATSPIGANTVFFDEQTGYLTFTFTFTVAGTYDIGLAVLNEGDTLLDAGLLVDSVSISGGVFSDGFEDGLGGWTLLGTVTTEGTFGGVVPPEGTQQSLLVSNGAESSAIETFLGLAPGTLSSVASQPVVTGNVLENDDFGADGLGGIVGISYAGNPLDVTDPNGATVDNVTTITAADGSWQLEFDLVTGDYSFTVLTPMDHPDAGADTLSFGFTYTIEDATGDTSSAALTIDVIDGVPIAVEDPAQFATAGGGDVIGNVLLNDQLSPDGVAVTQILLTGSAVPVAVPPTGSLVVATPLGGTLTISADGNWSYTPPETLPGNEPAADGFTYTVTDGDGDQSSAAQSILVQVGGNADPILTNNGAGTLVCGTEVIDADELSATDEDTAPELIEYKITGMTNGQVYLAGVALAVDSTFTQADLGDGLVYFQHDGEPGDTSAGFAFTYGDGVFTSTAQSFAITLAANGTETEGDVAGNVFNGEALIIGGTAIGSLTMAGGTLSNSEFSASAVVGDQAGSFGYVCVTGPNATWFVGNSDISGSLVVGNAGTGELRIENGADVTITSNNFDNLIIGGDNGGDGTVIVSGPGSTLTTVGTDNTIQVGQALGSTGHLLVEDGAVLSTLEFDIARFGTGQVDIVGVGSQVVVSNDNGLFSGSFAFEAGFVSIGAGDFSDTTEGGDGVLNVLDGGQLLITDTGSDVTVAPGMQIARAPGSTGIVNVSGVGSSIDIIQTNPDDGIHDGPFLEVGRQGDGELNVTADGAVNLLGPNAFMAVGRDAGSDGTLTILDGGRLEIRPGTENPDATFPFMQVAQNVGSIGTVLVDGVGSAIEISMTAIADPFDEFFFLNGPALNVGLAGQATMTVSNQATVTLSGDESWLGVGRGNVDLVIDDPNYVPGETILPQSLLRIESGGDVLVDGTFGFALVNAGQQTDGDGRIEVDGSGSTLTVTGASAEMDIGAEGNGELVITDGGTASVAGGNTTNDFSFMGIGLNAGSTGSVTVSGIGAFEDPSTLSVTGTDAIIRVGGGGTGELTVNDGGLVNTLFLEVAREGAGTTTIDGGTAHVSNEFGSFTDGLGGFVVDGGFVRVGRNAGSDGTLNVINGGVLLIDGTSPADDMGLQIARNVGSTGTVLVDGSTSVISIIQDPNVDPATNDSEPIDDDGGPFLQVGRAGQGNMTIANGGLVELSGQLAFVQVGRGNADEFEPGLAPDLLQSVLTISSGGDLVVDGLDGFAGMNIGQEANGNGLVTVSGSDSTLTIVGANSSIRVGNLGSGELTVSDGGNLDLIGLGGSASLNIGEQANSFGQMFVNGLGSTVDIMGLDANLAVGVAGNGELSLGDQATISINGTTGASFFELGVLADSSGLAVVFGENTALSVAGEYANITVGGEGVGSFSITTGADVTLSSTGGADLLIGNIAGSSGAMTLSNLGSTAATTGLNSTLVVGQEGEGLLLVEDKAILSMAATDGFSAMTVGAAEGGFGIVAIIGDESALTILGTGTATYVNLTIAEAGFGEMVIQEGADVTLDGTGNGDVQVGVAAGSTGFLVVTGAGSTLTATAQHLGNGMSLLVGVAGLGELQVVDSAQVVIGSPGFTDFAIGSDSGGDGTVFVTTGGSIAINGGQDGAVMTVGGAGIGSLEVSAGGLVTIGTATSGVTFVGSANGGAGDVLVDGEGSALNAGEELAIGRVSEFGTNGTGTVTVTSNGTISAGTKGDFDFDIWVGLGGTLGGNGTIVGDVQIVGGTIVPGVSPGALNIDGDLVVSSGIMAFELGGTAAGSFDVLAVTGQVTVVAPLVTFEFTYAPFTDDSIEVITAAEGIDESLEDVAVILTGLDLTTGFDFEVNSVPTGEVSESYILTVLSGAQLGNGVWFEANSSSWNFAGGTGADVLIGNFGADTLSGGDGNDTIEGGSGSDSLDGGVNDDTIHVSDLLFASVDGGTGQDRLVLDGSGLSLNLSTLPGALAGIEEIDLGGIGNSVTLSAADVLDISDSNTLLIDGTAADSALLTGPWIAGGTSTINSEIYQIYTSGSATALVDTDVIVVG